MLFRCTKAYFEASRRFLAGYYLVCVVFFVLAALAFRLEIGVAVLEGATVLGETKLSLGDYLFFLLRGSPSLQSAVESFTFPVTWFALFMLLCFGGLKAPLEASSGLTIQMMLAAGPRSVWVAARYAWCVAVVMGFWTLLLIIGSLFSLQEGGAMSFDVSPELLYVSDFPWQEAKGAPYSIWEVFLAAMILSLLAVTLQSVLSLLTSSVLAYGVSILLFLFWGIGAGGIDAGSSAMASRSSAFVAHGSEPLSFAAFALVALVAIGVIGIVLFKRKNIIGGGN